MEKAVPLQILAHHDVPTNIHATKGLREVCSALRSAPHLFFYTNALTGGKTAPL